MARLARFLPALAALAAFAPTIGFRFVSWDDHLHVWLNPTVLHPDPRTIDFWVDREIGYSITVPSLTLWLERLVHGFHPAGFHAVNVLLHVAATLLTGRLLERLGLKPRWAIAGALLFAVHPVVAEPVSWVTGRKDLVATVLALAALDCWLSPAPTPRRDAAGVGLFALAALSKPSVLALPLVVPLTRGFDRASARAAVPALVVSAAAALLPFFALGVEHAVSAQAAGPLPLRAFRALGFQLGLVARPASLQPLYLLDPPSWREPATLAGLALSAALLAVAVVARLRHTRAGTVALLGAAALAPVANVIPLTHEIGNSHLYLPMVAVAGLWGLLLERALLQLRGALQLAVIAVVPIVLLPFALDASSAWRSGIVLWSRAVELYPLSPPLCRNLAFAYHDAGRDREAHDTVDQCAERQGHRDYYDALTRELDAARRPAP